MPTIDEYKPGANHFLMGNEAISRGALEAGVHFASAYPGTPSSEIIQRLSGAAGAMNLHVEWSTNEKVAAEGAAAAAFAGLRSLVAMKNAGLSVALDYLTHLAYTGLGEGKGAMVTAVCDDPDAHSSGDETDSRWLAKFACTRGTGHRAGGQRVGEVGFRSVGRIQMQRDVSGLHQALPCQQHGGDGDAGTD